MKNLIKLYLPATGNVKKRDAIQADLDSAKSEAKRLKSEMTKKDEINKSIFEWMFKNNPSNAAGSTLLHWAAENENVDLFQSIFKEVQDKNPKDKNGQTPLHFAARNGQMVICEMILKEVQE